MESGKKSLEEQKKELAKIYAKFLSDNNLKPGDPTFDAPEEIGVEELLQQEITAPASIQRDKADLDKETKKAQRKAKKYNVRRTTQQQVDAMESIENAMAAPLFLIDIIADKISDGFHSLIVRFVTATSKIVRSYRNSRKAIATAVFTVCILCAVMLLVFDRFTVYEYAYNGKTLGYVKEQEEVTNVLAVAGEQLNAVNKEGSQEIEFVANDNISFKRVVASGIDTDDADTTVNRLAFMTDIEVEASGIYDGNKLVTIVKDQKAAEVLLPEVKAELGRPDEGMEVISVDFLKPLEIRPINVLLTSVQSNSAARKQMTKGGKVNFYHLVEENEDIMSIANVFGVEISDIYDEDNRKALTSVTRGDKVCIHKTVSPVSVEMIETGKMKEIVPYETIKKKSKDYYIGDEHVEVKGVNGVQIFEGTLTKVGGKVSNRKINNVEVLTKKVDELILVGTTKRPKTAPTGTFINPLNKGSYVITSRPGWRWGRTHEGVDMGCSVGNDVHATDGGVVVRAGVYGGYGYCVDIQHGDGWISRYGHLSSMSVKVGDKVYQGQYIADTGNSGRSTGPHLHFELRHNGAFVDPDSKVKGKL